MVIEVRAQLPADSADVHAVVARAFDDENVAALWEDLAARPRTASYVAAIDGAVVGHVGLSWGWIDGRDRLVGGAQLGPPAEPNRCSRAGVRVMHNPTRTTAIAISNPRLRPKSPVTSRAIPNASGAVADRM